MSLRFKAISDPDGSGSNSKEQKMDLGNGSEVVYVPRLLTSDESWKFFDYLNKEIPWTRPTIRVFGRSHVQPRDTCYVASKGLPELIYSGYQPHAFSWDDFPPLKDILEAVHKALPGSTFNSLLLNRYKGGNDNVGWHADDEKLYGPTPEIASVSFGCEREFLMKKKPSKSSQGGGAPHNSWIHLDVPLLQPLLLSVERRSDDDEPVSKRLKKSSNPDHHSFTLKHGSLLVMRGYTQRDWLHSVPKRAKAEATRINLTFRYVP
ncbi:hypothetical protein EZV62_005374 [Acer yangbiense]|uniref:Fe2OG dioxygenase domain-containing protein n=1 Tax=Acer yangbiense TaxID=1000413 RepID=A0A5C7IMZ4_9ROSI|nr:hypothetical protein EZV62_005374 [Acer yangbiense]